MNTKPFDMSQKPSKQYPFLMPIIWLGSYIMTRPHKLKIEKENMAGVKPPYLVIAAHQGFADYYIGPLAIFPHRAIYVSDMEGFAAFGKWLYRGLGCIGKRRYVPEIFVIKHIKYALSINQSVFIYPESRHSNVGTTAYIPKNLGRLAKMMNVPLVVLSENGSYLANPFWDEENTRKVPIKAKLTCLYNKEALKNASAEEVQQKIEEALIYDEYKYQKDNKIKISYKKRAEGLHKPLYQCINCDTKYDMTSYDSYLKCNCCGKKWEMNEYGELLSNEKNAASIHIPDWYEKEKNNLISELNKLSDSFLKEYNVSIEALYNENGFVSMGEGKLTVNSLEFELETEKSEHHFPHAVRESVQTEYNYKGKGMCIVLSTSNCCYYIYSKDKDFNPTELQFIGEYFYQKNHFLFS